MRILYHLPSLDTIYAQRTIYHGYKNAFLDLGHEFHTFTAGKNLERFLPEINPDIFITSSHFYYQKFLDYQLIKRFRDRGMKLFTKVDFWNSPIRGTRINEAKSLRYDAHTIRKIKDGLLGDAFFHVVEQGDWRMDGFEKETGYPYYTIPLAADRTIMRNDLDSRFQSDISFLGTYLPDKREYFKQLVFPLAKKYNLKIYGQDWTLWDRGLGWIQRIGQFFNVPFLRSIQKPKLKLGDEAKVYSSSLISINIHEEYQRRFGGDCNERTYKIPLCSGFEITDDVSCIRKYFKENDEIIIASNPDDWFEKIDYFINNPEKRLPIIENGKKRVLLEHTYHNRAQQIIDICSHI